MATAPSTSKGADQKRYVVDKSIQPLLSNTNTTTPSSLSNVSAQDEHLHRLHGTSLLHDASTILKLSPSTFATSTTIFHRVYHSIPLAEYDVWSVSMACVLIALKVEEDPRTVRSTILAFHHLYRRRRLRIHDDVSVSYGAAHAEAQHVLSSDEEKENLLRHVPPMSLGGAIYAEWKKALEEKESLILRVLGFTLFWIPDSHPHRFILHFVRVLEIEDGVVAQEAWNYCNDSCHLDLCVRYDAEVIASAAILLSCNKRNISLPLLPRPWWQVFIGPNRGDDLATVCNAILAVGDVSQGDARRARFAFVPSLLKNGSFNDPDSYIWSTAKD